MYINNHIHSTVYWCLFEDCAVYSKTNCEKERALPILHTCASCGSTLYANRTESERASERQTNNWQPKWTELRVGMNGALQSRAEQNRVESCRAELSTRQSKAKLFSPVLCVFATRHAYIRSLLSCVRENNWVFHLSSCMEQRCVRFSHFATSFQIIIIIVIIVHNHWPLRLTLKIWKFRLEVHWEAYERTFGWCHFIQQHVSIILCVSHAQRNSGVFVFLSRYNCWRKNVALAR